MHPYGAATQFLDTLWVLMPVYLPHISQMRKALVCQGPRLSVLGLTILSLLGYKGGYLQPSCLLRTPHEVDDEHWSATVETLPLG